MNFSGGKSSSIKYGLQLRAPKKPPAAPVSQSRPSIFSEEENDNDVEQEIARQASVKSSLKDVEEQHKKALEEDPSVFDYDGVYDSMKAKISAPRLDDRAKREPKYIQKLVEKAKLRQMEQEIVYERQLAKERSKEDHLYADKDKFVTSAYKKKLAERNQWLEQEKLRERIEEKEDVTKKNDLSDFYSNFLKKNVAFGASSAKSEDAYVLPKYVESEAKDKSSEGQSKDQFTPSSKNKEVEKHETESTAANLKRKMKAEDFEHLNQSENNDSNLPSDGVSQGPLTSSATENNAKKDGGLPQPEVGDESGKTKPPDRGRSEEALAAYRERFLARKKTRTE